MPYKIFIVCDIVEGFDFTGMGGFKGGSNNICSICWISYEHLNTLWQLIRLAQ